MDISDAALDCPIGQLQLSSISSLDKTPSPFEYLEGKIYNTILVGSKTVLAKSTYSGCEKRQESLVFCIFAHGFTRIPLIIIFLGTG